jgi:NADPH:quinone reductase-like Zn-dependent oxidoreductase
MTPEEAAAVPYGAIAPLYFLRDQGKVQSGQKVLIIGASGSVGTFAVQLARYYGARVTAVCSAANVERVKSLGAERVIDYIKGDYADGAERFDLIFDAAGKSSRSRCRRALNPNGVYVTIMKGGPNERERAECLQFLRELIQAGKLRSVTDRCYPLEQTAAAHRYVEGGRKQGTVVIKVD